MQHSTVIMTHFKSVMIVFCCVREGPSSWKTYAKVFRSKVSQCLQQWVNLGEGYTAVHCITISIFLQV